MMPIIVPIVMVPIVMVVQMTVTIVADGHKAPGDRSEENGQADKEDNQSQDGLHT
jgi:hypothetical protein